MCRYITLKYIPQEIIFDFEYQPSRLKEYILMQTQEEEQHAFRRWPEHLYMLGLHGNSVKTKIVLF